MRPRGSFLRRAFCYCVLYVFFFLYIDLDPGALTVEADHRLRLLVEAAPKSRANIKTFPPSHFLIVRCVVVS